MQGLLCWSGLEVVKVEMVLFLENMKRTRKIFVNSLNFAKKNKKNIADNILAEKYANNNSKDFWKEVKKRTTNRSPKIDNIDGKCNDKKISIYFSQNLKQFLVAITMLTTR